MKCKSCGDDLSLVMCGGAFGEPICFACAQMLQVAFSRLMPADQRMQFLDCFGYAPWIDF